jgi:hypothetical protein
MSLAVHLFVAEKFSEESYRRFLSNVQNLFGIWTLEEAVPFNDDPSYLTIHECWISSEGLAADERFRVNFEASKHLKDVFMWGFDYEWHLRLETSAGRSPLGLAVQLGGWLLATQHFRFTLALDRDSGLGNEPTDFRTIEAAAEHVRRLLKEKPLEYTANLMQRRIMSENGNLLLPQLKSASSEEKRL